MFQNKPQPQVFGSKGKPDDSAQLEIDSNSKGFLPPRMTTAERLAIVSPAEGLHVFDTDFKDMFVFDGIVWGTAGGGIAGPATSTDNAIARWDGVTGNAVQDSNVIIDDLDAVTGITELDVDNIKVDGNEISTTDTDGNLTLNPNGTGKVIIAKDLEVQGTTTTVNSDTLEVVDPNILVNKGGTESTADTAGAGITVEMSDATNVKIAFDSTTTSKVTVGEEGSEKEVVTVSDVQGLTNKTFSTEASLPSGLTLNAQSTVAATKPWPNMTIAQRDALTPSIGWVVYNTDDNELNIYDGTDWLPYNIGVYFMIEDGYKRDFGSSSLGTTFETIKTLAGGTLKAFDVVNNSGNDLLIRVTATGDEMLIARGASLQVGYRGAIGDVVQMATVSGTASTGNVYINFLGV